MKTKTKRKNGTKKKTTKERNGKRKRSAKLPYTTVYMTPAPPGPSFHGRYLHSSWNSVGCQKKSALKTSRQERAFRRRIIRYDIGTLLVVEQTAPGGCDNVIIHRPSYTVSQSRTTKKTKTNTHTQKKNETKRNKKKRNETKTR